MAEKTKENKLKKVMTNAMVINGVLIVLAILALAAVYFIDTQRSKVTFDQREITNVTYDSIFKNIKGKTYVSINDIVRLNQMKMFKINNGRYDSQKSGNKEAFYVDSIYEAVQFVQGSKTFTKYIKHGYATRQLDENAEIIPTEEEKRQNPVVIVEEPKTQMDESILNQEVFNLTSEIQEINGTNYIAIEDAKYVFNLKFVENGNNVAMYSIPYLEKVYENRIKQQNYTLSANYQNRRAIIEDKIVVAEMGKNWGLNIIENGDVNLNKVPRQYDDIRYSQSTKTVYGIKDKKIALINAENGKVIVALGNYDNLEVYSQEKGIYLVSKNKKYGLISNDGNSIVPIEFTKIGYDPVFFADEDTDGKLFFDKIIPVQRDNKWGFYKVDGKLDKVFDPVLTGIGFKKLELLESGSFNKETVSLTDEIVENLEKIGITISRSSSTMPVAQAEIYGFTNDQNKIKPGDSVLIVPEDTGFGGVVVRGENGKYGIVSSQGLATNPYALPLNYDRIYKESNNAITRYFAESNNGIDRLELKRENVRNNSINTNELNNNLVVDPNNQNNINTLNNNIVNSNQINNPIVNNTPIITNGVDNNVVNTPIDTTNSINQFNQSGVDNNTSSQNNQNGLNTTDYNNQIVTNNIPSIFQ